MKNKPMTSITEARLLQEWNELKQYPVSLAFCAILAIVLAYQAHSMLRDMDFNDVFATQRRLIEMTVCLMLAMVALAWIMLS